MKDWEGRSRSVTEAKSTLQLGLLVQTEEEKKEKMWRHIGVSFVDLDALVLYLPTHQMLQNR